MEQLYKMKERLIDEYIEYLKKQKWSTQDVMDMKYLASAADHTCNIIKAAEEEYSGRSMRYSRRGSYDDGYAREDGYPQDRGMRMRRDSMGRYSRHGDLAGELESLKMQVPSNLRERVQELIDMM